MVNFSEVRMIKQTYNRRTGVIPVVLKENIV